MWSTAGALWRGGATSWCACAHSTGPPLTTGRRPERREEELPEVPDPGAAQRQAAWTWSPSSDPQAVAHLHEDSAQHVLATAVGAAAPVVVTRGVLDDRLISSVEQQGAEVGVHLELAMSRSSRTPRVTTTGAAAPTAAAR